MGAHARPAYRHRGKGCCQQPATSRSCRASPTHTPSARDVAFQDVFSVRRCAGARRCLCAAFAWSEQAGANRLRATADKLAPARPPRDTVVDALIWALVGCGARLYAPATSGTCLALRMHKSQQQGPPLQATAPCGRTPPRPHVADKDICVGRSYVSSAALVLYACPQGPSARSKALQACSRNPAGE